MIRVRYANAYIWKIKAYNMENSGVIDGHYEC